MTVDLDELERLERAATPGPFRIERDDSFNREDSRWRLVSWGAVDKMMRLNCSARPRQTATVYSAADAEALMVRCNMMPSLIAELRAARERIAELELYCAARGKYRTETFGAEVTGGRTEGEP